MFSIWDTPKMRQYFAAFSCHLSVLLSAASFVWLEPLINFLSSPCHVPNLTIEDISWLVSIVEIGCFIAPIPSGILADRWGRKTMLLWTGPIFTISWGLALSSSCFAVLSLVRILQGIAIGMTFTIAPMYVAEISSAKIRGTLNGHFQTMWYLGILVIYISGLNLRYYPFVGFCFILPLCFMVVFVNAPESPYYYLMKGNASEAYYSLVFLYPHEDVMQLLNELRVSVAEDMKNKSGFLELFKTKSDRKAFFLVQIVGITRYLTGMPSIVNYATVTFAEGSGGFITKERLTIGLGLLLTVIAILAAHLADTLGRRYLLISSTVGCMVSHFLIGLYYFTGRLGYWSPPWVLYGGLIGFCFFSDIGLGPLVQTMQAEMFPCHTRGLGGGVSESIAAVASFINLKTYQLVRNVFGLYMNFWIYAIISLIGLILTYFYSIETAGKTLTEIRADLRQRHNDEQ